MNKEGSIIELIFPEGLLDYFEITNHNKTENKVRIYLEEKNIHPEEYEGDKLVSKGFYDPITIEDFPIRGRQVTLEVRRRRWTNETRGTIVKRDWKIKATGTKKTQEFATFLKYINIE